MTLDTLIVQPNDAAAPAIREHFDSVQSLRGIAAALVVLYHAQGNVLLRYSDHYSLLNSFYALRDFGGLGVDIFFVISGFIMVHTSRNYFGVSNAGVNFMLRRLIRIAPMYWLVTAFIISLLTFAPSVFSTLKLQWPHVIQSVLFLPTQNSAGEYAPVLNVGWTLTYEMYFYILFALLLAFPMRVSLIATTVLFAASALSRHFYYLGGPYGYVLQNDILLEFVTGEWIAYWMVIGGRMKKGLAYGLLAVAIVAFAVTIMVGPLSGIRFPDQGIPAAILLLTVVQLEQIGVLRCPRWLTEIGNESYSLYLIHIIVLAAFFKLMVAAAVANYVPVDLFIPAGVLISVVAARPSYLLVEKPLTAWLTATAAALRARKPSFG